MEAASRTTYAATRPVISRPKSPEMHNHRRSNIPVENSTALAAMLPFGKGLGLDRPALRTGLTCATRINQSDFSTGTCSLVLNELDELAPRGVVNGTGQHPSLEPDQVEVFKSNRAIAETLDSELCPKSASGLSDFRCRSWYTLPSTLRTGSSRFGLAQKFFLGLGLIDHALDYGLKQRILGLEVVE